MTHPPGSPEHYAAAEQIVVDARGQRLAEDDAVFPNGPNPGSRGRIERITDWDGDLDDEGRTIGYAPQVYVKWPEFEEPEAFTTSREWGSDLDRCEDLLKIDEEEA